MIISFCTSGCAFPYLHRATAISKRGQYVEINQFPRRKTDRSPDGYPNRRIEATGRDASPIARTYLLQRKPDSSGLDADMFVVDRTYMDLLDEVFKATKTQTSVGLI